MANEYKINNESLKRLALKEEPRFLSLLLKDKDALMKTVAYGIKTCYFNNGECKLLFELITKYFAKHRSMLTRNAIESISESVGAIGGKKLDEEDKATLRMSWDKIYSQDVSSEDYNFLLQQVNNRFIQQQACLILQTSMSDLIQATDKQDHIVKVLKENLMKIESVEIDSYTKIMGMDEGIDKVLEYLDYKRENPIDPDAIYTGIKAIDDIYKGFPYGSYTIITGLINGGKTVLMMNIAFNIAKMGKNVVYVSLEKEAVPFFARLLSLHALADFNRIKTGGKGVDGLNDFHLAKLKDSAKELKENICPKLTCVQMTQGVKISQVLSEVRKIMNTQKVDVLVVDYIGAIGNETTTPGRPDLDDARTSQILQSFGKEERLVLFTAAQLKTPSAKEARKAAKKASADDLSNVSVGTEDIAGSKMIIADADSAFGVFLNSDSPSTKMYVHILKARDAESRKTIVLDFSGALGRVADPVFQSGQVKDIDNLLYNKEITEDDLKSEDGLFNATDEKEFLNKDKPETITEQKTIVDKYIETPFDEDVVEKKIEVSISKSAKAYAELFDEDSSSDKNVKKETNKKEEIKKVKVQSDDLDEFLRCD